VDIPDAALPAVIEVARNNLELGCELEGEISHVSLRLPTLYPESKFGEHIYSDGEEYYILFARLFERLAAVDAPAARNEYQRWNGTGRFFVALRIWALANRKIVTAAEAGDSLVRLERDTFWDSSYARELLWAIKARWCELSKRHRRAIERKILEGRAKFDFESEAEYMERRSGLAATRLIWMRNEGLTLSRATNARVPTLKKADPNWRESWARQADASLESRSAWVKEDTDSAPLSGLPLKAIIARCDELAQRQFQIFTEHDPFRGLVAASPARAIGALAYESRRNNYPERYWSRLLSEWPKNASPRLAHRLAKLLLVLPFPVLVAIRYELGRWMVPHFQEIERVDRPLGGRLFDQITAALEQGGQEALRSGLGKTTVAGIEIPSNRMGVEYAINSPTGDLAQALMNELFARKPKAKQRIPKDLKPRIERLLKLQSEGGYHALTVVAQQLHGLHAIDPAWTETILLPRFDPKEAASEAAWSGFLAASRMPSPALFRELKANFVSAVVASSGWTFQGVARLAQVIVLALDPAACHKPPLSFTEARAMLQNTTAEIQLEALSFLRSRVSPRGAWNKLIVPFFRKVWPRDTKFQSPETTRMLLLLIQQLGDRFPEAVRLVGDFLVPLPQVDIFLFRIGRATEQDRIGLVSRFPNDSLFLLDKVVDRSQQRAPYGLAEVLRQISDAAPDLLHDDRWQRLHHLTIG
jgi:hypothetical protein